LCTTSRCGCAMCCSSDPPSATFTTCSPRHTASSGTCVSRAHRADREVDAVLQGVDVVHVLGANLLPVPGGIEVAAAWKQHSVDEGQPLGNLGVVERDAVGPGEQ